MEEKTTGALEVLTTRVLSAPRERVFQAWIDSDRLARWWGPNGFTNTFEAHEPVPGGSWRFVMHAPDGSDYPNESRYAEVAKPDRIVFDHLSGHRYRAVARFEAPTPEKTLLTWSMTFEDAAEFERVKPFIVQGNEQNLDRLEALLASEDETR